MLNATHALLKSLIESPLLIGDLPEAACFDRALLDIPRTPNILNFDQKLGHLYEKALATVLHASYNVDLLAHNIQISDENRRTIGELDFVVFDKLHNTHIHLELGVKFYLAYQNTAGWQFPGPNDRDNWPKKLARLQNHQLCLSAVPECKTMFSKRYNIDAIETRQLIYGCLFIPKDCLASEPRLEFMAENARIGRWLYVSQWYEHFSGHDEIYVIPKILWPIMPHLDNRALFKRYSARDFIDDFHLKGAMFVTQESLQTYFLVPDSWPASILANH